MRVIGSKKFIEDTDFYTIIKDIIKSDEIQNLKNFRHHIKTTRFQHSLNVAYYNYKICKFFGWDYISAARGGLLHDLYFYETKEYDGAEKHSKNHPKLALINAEKFTPNNCEQDIIAKHMFPMTLALPRYKETVVITFVDKYCAALEYFTKRGSYGKV